MARGTFHWIAGCAAVVALHCGGDDPMLPPASDAAVGDAAPGDTGVRPDGGIPDTGPRPDGGVVPPNQNVGLSGSILELESYLRGQTAGVSGVEVSALGVTDGIRATSLPNGNYSLEIPQNGKVVIAARKLQNRSTYNEITVGDTPITGKNFYLASDDYVTRLGAAYAVNVLAAFSCHPPNAGQCRYALVMGRFVDDGSYDNGTPTPVAGIARDDLRITGEGNVDYYKQGPYFLRPDGQPQSGLPSTQRERDPQTQKYRGGLYLYFVEVPITGNPPKQFEISASSYAGGQVRREFGPVIFKAFNGGLSWVTVPESGPTPQQPPPPPPVDDINFETQIYPLFLPVNQGGLGCQGCHTNQGGATPSGGMNLYGGPAQAYQALNPANYPNRVNVQDPTASYLLRRPLYEADGVQDHPIFAFLSDQDPSYQLVYNWIRGGAIFQGVVDPPVSFYNDVRPLLYRPDGQGGIGCYNCHVNGVDANNAPGGLYMGGNGNELYQELTADRATDNGQTGQQYRINRNPGEAAQSLLLLNPLLGSPEPHPAKLLNGTQDPRYQTLYRWINQGALNDTP